MKVKVAQSRPTLCTAWIVQSMEFSRPEYWSRWPIPSPGDLPNPGIEPGSPALQVDSLPAELPGNPTLKLFGVPIYFTKMEVEAQMEGSCHFLKAKLGCDRDCPPSDIRITEIP